MSRRRAGLPARCGSSLQRNDAGVWLCEYPGLSFQRCPVRACSLVSSLLLNGATMSQESSLTQSAHSVRQVLTAYNLAPLRKRKWYVYSKPPFGGPKAVLAYLSRYTHRVAISNRRLIAFNKAGVTFRYKDYRADGHARYKRMTLATHEFIRRFLIHVLPDGFHRIRYYGLFANANRANNIALARRLLAVPDPTPSSRASDHAEDGRDDEDWNACPCCGGRMIIVEAFEPGCQPRFWPVTLGRAP